MLQISIGDTNAQNSILYSAGELARACGDTRLQEVEWFVKTSPRAKRDVQWKARLLGARGRSILVPFLPGRRGYISLAEEGRRSREKVQDTRRLRNVIYQEEARARASMKTQERKENRGSGIYSFGPVTYKNQQQIGNARNAKLQRFERIVE